MANRTNNSGSHSSHNSAGKRFREALNFHAARVGLQGEPTVGQFISALKPATQETLWVRGLSNSEIMIEALNASIAEALHNRDSKRLAECEKAIDVAAFFGIHSIESLVNVNSILN